MSIPLPPSQCLVCDSRKFSYQFEKESLHLWHCNNCGLGIIHPLPKNEDIQGQYLGNETSSENYYSLTVQTDVPTFKKRWQLINKRFQNPQNYLDIGANVGTFLLVGRDTGNKNGEGLEPNPSCVQFGNKKGINLRQGFFDSRFVTECKSLSKSYDIVHLGDVIEHFPNPKDALCEIREILRPNGMLVMITPDYDSWVARKVQIKPHEHLWYFNQNNMSILLSKCGFDSIEILKTTRRRNIGAMAYGSTFKHPLIKKILWLLGKTKLEWPLATALELMVRDELLIFARRRE